MSFMRDKQEKINKNLIKKFEIKIRSNKNCLGSFQVLWNKNCNTWNEKIF